MKSIIQKVIFCFCILSILFLISKGYSDNSSSSLNEKMSTENKEQERSKNLEGLQLNIALVLSDKEKSPRLAFIAKNNSNKNVSVPEFCKGPNKIELTKPNGKKSGDIATLGGTIREVVIKPSETKTWFMDATYFYMIFLDEGLYRIKWRIYNAESKEFLLLKEKDKNESQPAKPQ